MVNTLQLLLTTLYFLSPLVVCQQEEVVVVRTPPSQPPAQDGVALLNIEQLESLTLCMRIMVTQYNNLHHVAHTMMGVHPFYWIGSVTNKCHPDNENCQDGYWYKRYKDLLQLGQTFGMVIYNGQFKHFNAWVPGEWRVGPTRGRTSSTGGEESSTPRGRS